MQKSCTQCSAVFALSSLEGELLHSLGVNTPMECPPCRRQKRLLFRNFFHLYHRTCDLTGKKIISMYDSPSSFPVYTTQEWWSDRWDGLQYGKEWNATEPWFRQVAPLHGSVPRMSIMNTSAENCDYCNLCFYSKNCYLVHGCVQSEDCLYGHIVWKSKNCIDCLYLYECEQCLECIDCVKCHSLRYSRDCDNCSDSLFLVRCIGCSDCFGCVGLQRKKYHIFNEPHTKGEYEQKMQELNTGSRTVLDIARKKLRELASQETVKCYHGFGCENVTGDYLYNCKNIVEGYDVKRSEDCAHIATCEGFHSSMDCNFSGTPSEHSYQSLTIEGYGLIGCHTCLLKNANLVSCDNCYSCQDCIGCVGLKGKRYCILNRQYSEQEYGTLSKEIISSLRKSGEYGSFFPAELSPFGYNETIASHYFPETETSAKARGWQWKDEKQMQEQYLGPRGTLPDDVLDAHEDLVKNIFVCEKTDKLYKILPQELALYRSLQAPLPRECFEERHRRRLALRNPRHLYPRSCAKCSTAIQTTYTPERPETVLCESCYRAAMYS